MPQSCSGPDRLTIALTAAVLAVGVAPAVAQQNDGQRIVEQLVNFVVTAEHVRHIAGGLSRNEMAIDPACDDVDPLELLAVELVAPVELDIQGRPVVGTWLERWRVEACDGGVVRNALFEVEADGRIAMFPLAPGMTRLNPANQARSVPHAIAMVGNRLDGCTEVRLVDTNLPEGAVVEAAGAWQEHWTFDACGETYRLTIQFAESEAGLVGAPVDE